MAFFALFMGMILCKSESTSQTKGMREDVPRRPGDEAPKRSGDARLAEGKKLRRHEEEVQNIPCFVSGDPWKIKKNINQKTHFYVVFACKTLFFLSLLIPPLHHLKDL